MFSASLFYLCGAFLPPVKDLSHSCQKLQSPRKLEICYSLYPAPNPCLHAPSVWSGCGWSTPMLTSHSSLGRSTNVISLNRQSLKSSPHPALLSALIVFFIAGIITQTFLYICLLCLSSPKTYSQGRQFYLCFFSTVTDSP